VEPEWRLAQHADDYVPRIQRRIASILNGLAEIFNDKNADGVKDMLFAKRDDSVIVCDVKSAFGGGRIRLSWSAKVNSEDFGARVD
jgi:hypothetical protein